MFFFGENTTRRFDDFRPEVHDSDGLLLHLDTGEWLWRPLDNPPRVNVSSFATRNPRGFGLLQRDRDFASYQDIETRSELRPSVWIVPRGDWGEGHVELVEIPTMTEKERQHRRLLGARRAAAAGPVAVVLVRRCTGTATIRPGRPAAASWPRGAIAARCRMAIASSSISTANVCAAFPPTSRRAAVVSAGPQADTAELLDQHVVKNPATGGWRLSFQLRPERFDPIELRAYLTQGDDVLTETWSYTLLPQLVAQSLRARAAGSPSDTPRHPRRPDHRGVFS